MRELPPGYTVRRNPFMGVEYLNPLGTIVFQHPIDTDSARFWVWQRHEGGAASAVVVDITTLLASEEKGDDSPA